MACAAGCSNQGVIGIKYWTGVDADPTVMRAELASVLGV